MTDERIREIAREPTMPGDITPTTPTRTPGQAIALSLLASLCTCEHMGDVSESACKAAELLGLKLGDEDWPDCLWNPLVKIGDVRSLYGTKLTEMEAPDAG